MTLRLRIAALTNRGRVREHNEDCIAADAAAGVAILADGMGGHNAGEVASRIAVELVHERLVLNRESLDSARAEALIAELISAANSSVLEAARTHREYEGMGTTLVVAAWHATGVTFGHVGDSRLYVLRAGALSQLTRDHSMVQEQLDGGILSAHQAQHAPYRNVLTRAVGIGREVRPDVQTCAVDAGEVYLLCSDGLTDMLTDGEIRDTLAACAGSPQKAVQSLVEQANESGGVDNISVIVTEVAGGQPGEA